MNRNSNNKNAEAQGGHLSDIARAATLVLTMVAVANAQSPWESAVTKLATSFTGPIAKGLSLVAIVVGGLAFAYSEGGSKKAFAGIVFGIGMAVSAAAFLLWLFGIA